MLFDDWVDRYDQWFNTPIGVLVKKYEVELIDWMLEPAEGENLLDAGCGTGIFTLDVLQKGARVTGLDISRPMLLKAISRCGRYTFYPVQGDMLYLPFKDHSFDKTVSITALEFITSAEKAIAELFRVTRPGGLVVVATLNSLSPWAARRRAKTLAGQRHILGNAIFRSPDELLSCVNLHGKAATCIHFQKDEDPLKAIEIEREGQRQNLNTGAFVAVRWQKPA
jgi:ubiquinone/menaquinone biosynthesis C-methylase UbiE